MVSCWFLTWTPNIPFHEHQHLDSKSVYLYLFQISYFITHIKIDLILDHDK